MDSEDLPDLIDLEEDNEGSDDNLSPFTVREQRVARARRFLGLHEPKHLRGDQVDRAVAEDHRTTDVSKVLQLLRSFDVSVIREVLQHLHVKWYHCEIERGAKHPKSRLCPTECL